MKKTIYFFLTVITVLTLFAFKQYTQAVNFKLNMLFLQCQKTTESGADEVYILVFGKKSNGETFFERLPGDNRHWDMNDGDQPHDNPNGDSRAIHNKTLFEGELKEGESWMLNVIIAEEDGGGSQIIQERAAQYLSQSSDPYSLATYKVLDILNALNINISDTDDYIAIFGIKAKNVNGKVLLTFNEKEGVYHKKGDNEDPTNPNKIEYLMNHDGSDYVGRFGLYNF